MYSNSKVTDYPYVPVASAQPRIRLKENKGKYYPSTHPSIKAAKVGKV